ncbi:Kinase, NEK [Giardia muris]|uniref:Kinase, NEK n=1 Tax=Giardia muris TaxID=5742 RepID=A0A4Z1SP57_GIAMU|nr:Kinase, NEK [Giardia muris]|eukprot:TNJ27420.1 Kinase, NEK [Giardia muris]
MSVTDLMKAARDGNLEDVKRNLSQAGKKDEDGWTALMCASSCPNCIPLLEEEIGIQNNDGLTTLMLSVLNGKTDCVRLLLFETGKQTRKEWIDFPPGTTALMMAAHRNRPEVVKLLLPYEQGLKDSKGHTAQWHANNGVSWGGDFTQVRQLLENEGTERLPPPKEQPSLMASAITGDIEGVRKHLDHVGYQDPTGTTTLMMAAGYGHSDCILFLEKEIGMQNNDGKTALMKAAMKGRSNFIPLLEKELGMQDNHGLTALMLAAFNGHSDCIPLLKEEIGKRGKNGETALMLAAKYGHVSCIPLLEREIGMQSNDGWTALMLAAYNGRTDCVKVLLSEAGKQSMEKWNDGLNFYLPGTTALMIAARRNHPEMIELILPYEQGMEDSKGHTAQWYTNNGDLGEDDFTSVRELLKNEGTERIHPPSNLGEVLRLQEHLSKLTTENDTLKMELADRKARILALEKENARLKNEYFISSAIQGDLSTLRRHLDQAGQKDSSGMTALMHAASRGQTEVVRLLRPLEARLQDGRGWTALMHAVGRGHEECVGLLLLERDLKDGEGRTAEDVANGLPDGKKKITPLLRKKVHLPDLPDELSSFQPTWRLGRGAFGTVFSAWSEEHGNCALKVVEYEEMERTIVDSLRREMGTIPSLEHPHVLRYHRVHDDPDNGTAYLVMEWCSGTLLDEVRGRGERGEPFRDEEVWRCLREMASGLAYLHEKRLVHRDLKPANVFLAPDGRCILGDFGVARTLGDSSRMNTHTGTDLYMAPEIHQGKRYDNSVDVWALGVVAHELCTGELPFFTVPAILERGPPAIENRDGGLVTLISRMLSKDPEDRPTAQDVLEEAERHQ